MQILTGGTDREQAARSLDLAYKDHRAWMSTLQPSLWILFTELSRSDLSGRLVEVAGQTVYSEIDYNDLAASVADWPTSPIRRWPPLHGLTAHMPDDVRQQLLSHPDVLKFHATLHRDQP